MSSRPPREGKVEFLSWRSLITGAAPKPDEIRRFIEVKPRLDFNALEPGKEANDVDPRRRAGSWASRPPMA